MIDSWNQSLICHTNRKLNTEICALYCPMYQYATNLSAIDHYENKPQIPFTYAFIYLFVYFATLITTNSFLIATFPQLAPPIVSAISSICASFSIGLYAGSSRTTIRQKYNIEGSSIYDVIVHTLVSPCALCQEAYEIEYRTSTYNCYEIPTMQAMKA